MGSERATRVKRVGNYIIGKTVGEGTFGKVKLGTHIPTNSKVAMKVLEKRRIVDAVDMERISREIHILKLISHPYVLRLFEVINTPNHIYLVTDFATGGELFDYIVARGRLKEREACRFFHQISEGVDYCHKHHVIHRDLKPENLLLDEHKNIKIIDFGLSNTIKANNYLKTACGSPCYAAPEMIAGKQYAGPSVDIWSMGVILFALICGYLPFEDSNTSALYQKILSGRFTIPPFVSPGARDLLRRILVVNPQRRYTIDQIKQHPWYRNTWSGPGDEEAVPVYEESGVIDEEILSQLPQFGFEIDFARECIENQKHNQVTATYHLLKDRKTQDILAGRYVPKDIENLQKMEDTQVVSQMAPPENSLDAIPEDVQRDDMNVDHNEPMPAQVVKARRQSVADPSMLRKMQEEATKKKEEEEKIPIVPRRRVSVAVNSQAAEAVKQAGELQQKMLSAEEKQLRVYRGAFNVSTTSSKSPNAIREEMNKAIEATGISSQPLGPFGFRLEEPKTNVCMEMEVCKLEKFQSLFVVHLRRISGDTWAYKDLCSRLVQHMVL
eukprot:TRINITY_DN3127_c0_g1_i3.p1 TRINITY_DN3127_c0_g1~~TRINITY_DN3127_c0_g1_i3.p1  ORF type:complete len:565 (+),score=176.91 TRINITY_DN3127_c0_g1_i3:31-1695(+)